MNNIITGLGFLFTAQVMVWFQLYAPLKIPALKNWWYIMAMSLPITWLFSKGITQITQHFDGQMWPSRFMTFSIGVVSFTVLTWLINQEPVSLKTGICLGLSIVIIIIQIIY